MYNGDKSTQEHIISSFYVFWCWMELIELAFFVCCWISMMFEILFLVCSAHIKFNISKLRILFKNIKQVLKSTDTVDCNIKAIWAPFQTVVTLVLWNFVQKLFNCLFFLDQCQLDVPVIQFCLPAQRDCPIW